MVGIAINVMIMQQILQSARISDILDAMYEAGLAIGADRFSYHPEVMFEGVASAKSDVYSRGYPEEWLEAYINGGYQLIDPHPDLIMEIGKPITFDDAVVGRAFSRPTLDYIAIVQRLGISKGMGFPLWGPLGQNAFVGICFADPERVLSYEVIKAHHTLLLTGHQKIVELLPADDIVAVLSGREIEVLSWASRGKSNADIGTILSISPETVATYIRRIFNKLDCNDRIGAVIKALKMGLIRV